MAVLTCTLRGGAKFSIFSQSTRISPQGYKVRLKDLIRRCPWNGITMLQEEFHKLTEPEAIHTTRNLRVVIMSSLGAIWQVGTWSSPAKTWNLNTTQRRVRQSDWWPLLGGTRKSQNEYLSIVRSIQIPYMLWIRRTQRDFSIFQLQPNVDSL